MQIREYGNKIKNSYCKNCGSNENSIIETPYSFKLFNQEFEGMGIQVRFNCDHVDLPIDEDLDFDSDVDIDIDVDMINEEPIEIAKSLSLGLMITLTLILSTSRISIPLVVLI